MATNSVQTVWKLILDENAAREGENMIQHLARTVKDKLGTDATRAIDQTTEAIKDQTDALKENEKAAKASGSSLSATQGVSKGLGGAGRAAGIGDLLGAGEGLRLVGDTADAIEGLTELGGVLTGTLVPALAASGIGVGAFAAMALPIIAVLAAAGLAFKALTDSVAADAERIKKLGEERLSYAERFNDISPTQAKEDLNNIKVDRQNILDEIKRAEQEYNQFLADQPDIIGAAGDNLLKVFDKREEELSTVINNAKAKLGDLEAQATVIEEGLAAGKFTGEDTVKTEKKLSEARSETADVTNKASQSETKAQQQRDNAAREAEKAQQEAQRKAEQFAQKQQQIEESRYKAAQKYGDALVDIARKSADDAIKASKALREKQTDNQRGFNQDISDMTTNFHAGEMEEEIKRQDEEAATLRQHVLKLEGIRDAALLEETDLLRKRNFLDATRVREQANLNIEGENNALIQASEEKRRLQEQEDAAQLRELDKSRQDRMTALQRANDEARIAYQRDLVNQRDARKIAEREAAIGRNRELRAANEMAMTLLGIKQQQGQAELNIANQTFAGIRAMGNNTVVNNNNNSRNNYGTVSVPVSTNDPRQMQQHVLQVLGKVGLV
jgi:hypothetical protein